MKDKILVTGWYHHGNFGDDLMGIIWALYLKQLGYPFYIVGLKELHKKYFDFEFGPLPEKWEDEYTIVMFGGGGIYANVKVTNGSRDTYDFQLEDVVNKAVQRKYPIYVMSAGADKQFDAELLAQGRKTLFENATVQTVRNTSDKELLEQAGKDNVFYFPDMLWRTPDFFNVEPLQKNGKKRIAINVELKGSPLRKKLIKAAINTLVFLNPGIEFVFMDIWYGGYDKTATMHAPSTKNSSTYVFKNIQDDLNMLASCDLVITTKLHLGLVSMAYGTPVISYLGEDKTKLLFNSLDLNKYCISIKETWKLLFMIKQTDKLAVYKKFLASDKVEKIKQAAEGHFKLLKEYLSKK